MKILLYLATLVALVSTILGIISRWMVKPLMKGIEAHAFLQFAGVCLLFALVFGVIELIKAKAK